MAAEDFDAACQWLTSSSKASGAGNDVKLQLYGLFKFINSGSGPEGSRPGMFSFEGRAKYDAWARVAKEYTSVEVAKARYVEVASQLGWVEGEVVEDQDDAKPKSKSAGFGPTMSMPVQKDEDDDQSPVHAAASEGELERLQALVKDGASVNEVDEFGFTPLHLAADRGHAEIVKFLLQSGADASLKDPDDQTAMELASVSGRDDIVAILSQHEHQS